MPVGLYFLMLLLPRIDPRKANYKVFEGSYYKLRLILALFIGLINAGVIWGVLNNSNAIHKFLPASIFLMFMLIGNYMGNFRPNYFVGIKVPWTLNSDEVWIRTHKLAGKLWFWGGLAGIVLYFITERLDWVIIPLTILLVLVPMVYSYIIYQKAGDKKPWIVTWYCYNRSGSCNYCKLHNLIPLNAAARWIKRLSFLHCILLLFWQWIFPLSLHLSLFFYLCWYNCSVKYVSAMLFGIFINNRPGCLQCDDLCIN